MQWMLGRHYTIGHPSPQDYLAINELQYIDNAAMENLRSLAERRIVAVLVKDGEIKQDFGVALQLLSNISSETSDISIKNFPQELFDAVKNIPEPEKSKILSHVEEIGRVLSVPTSNDADLASLSESLWHEVDRLNLSPDKANLVYQILSNLVGNRVKVDEQLTLEFRSMQGNNVPTIERRIEIGDTIVKKGQIITTQIASLLHSQGYIGLSFPLRSFIFCCGLIVLLPFWFNIFITKELPQRRRLPWFFISLIMGASWFVEILGNYLNVVGLGIWFLIVSSNIALSPNVSFSISLAGNFVAAFLMIRSSFGNMGLLLFMGIICTISGYYVMRNLVSRRKIMHRTMILGLVFVLFDALLRWAINLPFVWFASVELFALGVFLSFVFSLSLSFIEGIMGIVTPMRLREICHPSVPLLKKLQIEIPGTYQHALTLGSLAETVAEELSLDGNLMKAGAFYHDIGKLRRPLYYVENQLGVGNIQDYLSPPLSAVTIIAHVKEGLELAAEYGLPAAVRDFIAEHHGTTFLGYFYKKAMAEGLNVSEEQFCYPGPKPKSRETALLMLLDSMEAGMRSSVQNISSAADIEKIIDRVFDMKLSEGQLDDVNFTFRDMARIKEVMLKTFQSMYHTRKIKELQDKAQH
ncbi:MAG: HDIG domain-containing protein [Synergistaceae bacterium]|nr:HDIG domain-containing protein [Synergistaceae bacterium]